MRVVDQKAKARTITRSVPCRKLMDRLRSKAKSSKRHSAIFVSLYHPLRRTRIKNEMRGVGMMITTDAQ